MDVAHFGRAAHITAASPGGPRYDPTASSAERRSINNAIWLCANHADEIDDNSSRYDAELLRDWKKQAEAAADAEKGRPLPHHDDGTKLLVSALTGQSTNLAASAISNVHQATGVVLEQIDPRIQVETAYRNGTTYFTLHPQETIFCKLQVPKALTEAWIGAYPDLVDHAREVKLPATGVQVLGSPLLEQIWTKDNQLRHITFTPHRHPAKLKLRIANPSSGLAEQLDDCPGHAALGEKTLRFEGSLFGGLISLASDAPHQEGPNPTGNAELERDFAPWSGKPIGFLPFFDSLDRLSKMLLNGWRLEFSMELDGYKLFDGQIDLSPHLPYLQHIRYVLDYINLARKLQAFLGRALTFNHDLKISNEDFEDLAEIVETIDGRVITEASDLPGNPTCRLSRQGNPQLLERISAAHETGMTFQFVENEGVKFSVLGQNVDLPRRVIELVGVRPHILEKAPSSPSNDSFTVEWIPTEQFRMRYRFISDNDSFLADNE